MTSPPAFCFHLTMGREELYNLERPESCSSLSRPPVNRGEEKRDTLPGGGAGFYECWRGGRQKNEPQKLCDIHKNTAKNLSEIFWSADLILALFLRIFPVSIVLCCRVRACAGSRFGAIPPPFHPKSGKRSGRSIPVPGSGCGLLRKSKAAHGRGRQKNGTTMPESKKNTDQTVGAFC